MQHQTNQPQQTGQLYGQQSLLSDGQASQTARGLRPRSVNDTNVDQFTRFTMQHSHLKPSSHLTDKMKERAQIDLKLLLLPSPLDRYASSGRTNDDSKTEEADISQYIHKQSPIKLGDPDSVLIEKDVSYAGPQKHQMKQQPTATEVEVNSRMELQRAITVEQINKLKKEAILAKKEWRQKRLTQNKKHVQMEEDQELNMIMTHSNASSFKGQDQSTHQMRRPEMNRGPNNAMAYPGVKTEVYDHQKQDENVVDASGNQMAMPGYQNIYQQNSNQNSNRYYQMIGGQRQPNQDLINLESNLQLQQEQERRSKRQQQQLQEQQFRLSMGSMKTKISEVIMEELNESQRTNTGRDSLKEGNESMIKQDNNFDEEVVGEISKLKDENNNQMQQVDHHHQGDKRRKQQAPSTNAPATASSTQAETQAKKQVKQLQQSSSPESAQRSDLHAPSAQSPPIQCLEVDETEFSKIQKLIDTDEQKPIDPDLLKKNGLNMDLEEIESKKYLEVDEIQDQIQELLDQKTDEVKQQISKAEKKQMQKMSYQMLFQDSFYSQKQETAAEQVDVESPGIKTEQVLASHEQSVGEIVDNEKEEQQNDKLIEFQLQLEQLQKMTSNLNEFVERGNYLDAAAAQAAKSQQEGKEEDQKRAENEQKDNLESQAQQSQLFDKSTVHTLKEDKNHMRLDGRSQTQSDHGMNDGIINIKTNKINFKKSQSMRKIKVNPNANNGKNIKVKRAKLKRYTKAKASGAREAKALNQPLGYGRRYAANMLRNGNQPKKSHSLDSMQVNGGNQSIVSPTYAGSIDFTNNPAAYYAIQRGNIEQPQMNQRFKKKFSYRDLRNQTQLQVLGGNVPGYRVQNKPFLQLMNDNMPKTKWRSNSPKKGDSKLMRRTSYSPVHRPAPIYYELHQQVKKSGGNQIRDLRSERKMLKSAHSSLIYLKGHQAVRYQGLNNQTVKNPSLKKLKIKKLQSAMDPNYKQQNLQDNRIMIRAIQSPQAHLTYNRHQDNMVPVGAYARMQGGGQAMNNYSGSVNVPLIAHQQMLRSSATQRIDSANSYFANSAISSQQQQAQIPAGGLQKGLIRPIQVYNMPSQMLSQDAQMRQQMMAAGPQTMGAVHGASQKRDTQKDMGAGQKVKQSVRIAPDAMSGSAANFVPPRPPRQQKGNDIKNSTLGGSTTAGLLQSAQSQSAMMDNYFMQRHKSAKSALRPNALYNPLMPGGISQPSTPTGQQIDYQFTSTRSVFDRMPQVKGGQQVHHAIGQPISYQGPQSLAKPVSSSHQRFDSQQRQMGSSLMAAGPATGPVAVMEQPSQQANNMYYRGKNAMDDKYYNSQLMGTGNFQSVSQLVAQGPAPQLQQSQSANTLPSQGSSFAPKHSPYTQKLRLPRSSQSRRVSQAQNQMMAAMPTQGGTTQLLQMTNPLGNAHHLNATQRPPPSMSGGSQMRQSGFQKQPMTIRYKQYQSMPRNGNASYPILHMNGLV